MLIRAANFHFDTKENRQALLLAARALKLEPTYWDSVFSDYEKRRISLDDILRYGLPDDQRVWQEYLRRMLDEERVPDAIKTWDWILPRRYADDKLAAEYVSFLLRSQRYETAQQAWARYADGRDKSYSESNRIFNGSFESDPTTCPLDWTINPASGASVDFDRDIHYAGTRSLRIQFDGSQNVGNIGVRQTVFLTAGRYRFAAYVRTKDISTDEGIAFNLMDPEAPQRLNFTTEALLGTNDWKLIEHQFQVRPGTGLIQLSIVRKPSLRFDNLIRGTAWIDQLSITSQLTE